VGARGVTVHLLRWQGSCVLRIALYPATRDEPGMRGPIHIWSEHRFQGGKV